MSLYKVFQLTHCYFFLFYNLLLVQKKVIYFYLSWVKFNFSISMNILNFPHCSRRPRSHQTHLLLLHFTSFKKNWGYQLSRLLRVQSPMFKPILNTFPLFLKDKICFLLFKSRLYWLQPFQLPWVPCSISYAPFTLVSSTSASSFSFSVFVLC